MNRGDGDDDEKEGRSKGIKAEHLFNNDISYCGRANSVKQFLRKKSS
jgi:hypothetical protein